MNHIYYFYSLSFLYLLLFTEWIHAASLRSLSHSRSTVDRRLPPALIVDMDVTTSEPVLCRRRPILISNKRRRKRWSKDDDEDEIPLDETEINPSANTFPISDTSTVFFSDEISSDNSTLEIKHLVMPADEEVLDSTSATSNQPTFTTSDPITESNVTETDRLSTNEPNINQTISDEKNDTIIDDLTTKASINEQTESAITDQTSTIDTSMANTAITLLDYTVPFAATIDTDQVSPDSSTEILLENSTITNNSSDNSTIISNEEFIDNTTMSQNGTEVTEQVIDESTMVSDIVQNDTSTVIDEEDESSNETTTLAPTKPAKPICDQSCQCLRKCHYGFEIVNGTCQCDEPCKNYQCFRNDTCSVSKDGKPVCKPDKGSTHDRPSRCYQARDAGYHDDGVRYYDRWYYNADQDTCHLFVYRGMGGNENNFATLHECHVECITCAPSPDPGACLAHLPMWYYDSKKNQCSQFIYTGCKGNDNKFLRKQECIDTCITRIINL